MMKLTEAVVQKDQLEKQIADEVRSFESRKSILSVKLREALNVLACGGDGLDVEKIQLAETFLEVLGLFSNAGGSRETARSNAITALSEGGATLWIEYQGTKSYDRWHGQHIACEYGMCPRHGSVIFEIGLNRQTRDRVPRELSALEIEAGIYYLLNLPRIQAHKSEVKRQMEPQPA